MRFHYPNLTRPKSAAKSLVKAIDGLALSRAQAGLAQALGYRDWHELETRHADKAPTPLDQDMADTEAVTRLGDVAIALADALDLYRGDAAVALIASRATGDLKLDPWLRRNLIWTLEGIAPLSRAELPDPDASRRFTREAYRRRTRPLPPTDRIDEPGLLQEQIPFPPAARRFVDRLVSSYELEHGTPVLQAWYRKEDARIRVSLLIARIEGTRIVDIEENPTLTFPVSEMDWQPSEKIHRRSELPGFLVPRTLGIMKLAADAAS